MLAEPDRYRAPPEANVPLMKGLNTNVGFKTINISFLSSNVTWFSHIPWLLQTTERIQRGIFWYIYELFVLFHLWNTFVCQWPIFHFLVQIHNNHDSLLSPGHDPNVLLIWLFPVLFYLWIFNIRDSGSNLNIVEFNQSFLLRLAFPSNYDLYFDEPGAHWWFKLADQWAPWIHPSLSFMSV